MYRTAQSSGQTSSQPGPDPSTGGSKKTGSDEVTDVDFEEVK